MMVQTAGDDVEDGSATQTEKHHNFHDWKSTAFFLGGGLGVVFLIERGVGELRGGTIHHFDGSALQGALRSGSWRGGPGGGVQHGYQSFFGQTQTGLDIGRVALVDGSSVAEAQERLHLADDFAATGFGFEHLPEEALDGQAQVKATIAAVGTLLGAGE